MAVLQVINVHNFIFCFIFSTVDRWFDQCDKWEGLRSSWRRVAWKEFASRCWSGCGSGFLTGFLFCFCLVHCLFYFLFCFVFLFNLKMMIWKYFWGNVCLSVFTRTKRKVSLICVLVFYDYVIFPFKILGICFAQNLRADIFAQMAKWSWHRYTPISV